tara:strand:- start:41602 stop:41796 length:195 start_codon:yes stop_codon:yes gene_type:complete
MALIQPKQKIEKRQIKVTLDSMILDQMNAYCEWQGIEKVDDFIEQAALFVFSKDREWKAKQHAV